jgi:DNA (cytosine-5)-methyltransferase 1
MPVSDFDLPAISLFTGAGGLDLGLEQAGFNVRVCVESNAERCQTLSFNRPKWKVINESIKNVPTRTILRKAGLRKGEAALVSGGPMCQPFSKSAYWVPGRVNSVWKDPRVSLLSDFARVVIEARPRAFIMENVAGLSFKNVRPVLSAFVRKVEKRDYSVTWAVLNAAHYGVPQKRERLFVLGVRQGDTPEFPPPPTHFEVGDNQQKGKLLAVSSGIAISLLDDGRVMQHEKVRGKWGYLLPRIPPGKNYLYLSHPRKQRGGIFRWRSRYWSFLLKLSPKLPSWTIQATPGPYVGPFHWRNRKLRISEIRRLQTFPDNVKFAGDERSKWRQIGDAVPPLLAWHIGRFVRNYSL